MIKLYKGPFAGMLVLLKMKWHIIKILCNLKLQLKLQLGQDVSDNVIQDSHNWKIVSIDDDKPAR